MSTRAELKARARESIKGNIWKLFLALLLVALVPAILGGISGGMMAAGGFLAFIGGILYIAVIVVALAASIGYTKIMMKVARNQEYDIIKDTFNKDNLKVFLPLLGLAIVMCIFVTIASIVVIPGIILAYSYYFAPYMTIENGKGASNLHDCRMMMKGHKWDLFVLDLTFIGWILLCGITFGIAGIYVIPYMTVTQINFYDELKALNANVVE